MKKLIVNFILGILPGITLFIIFRGGFTRNLLITPLETVEVLLLTIPGIMGIIGGKIMKKYAVVTPIGFGVVGTILMVILIINLINSF